MQNRRYIICVFIFWAASFTALAADQLPPLDVAVTKYIGTTRSEEIMLNRIVPYAGAHLGGVHVDTSTTPNRFYVFDAGNNRILGYREFKPVTHPGGPYPTPDIVIGQFSAWDSGAANHDNLHFLPAGPDTLALLPFPYVSSTMEAPRSGMMATDTNGNFYVVDLCNNRVLKYNDPFTNDQVADDVWGQANFTDRGRGTTSSNLYTDWNYGSTIGTFSAGVDVDQSGAIWVADSFNNRVLRFPSGSKKANLVVGQSSFLTQSSGTALNKMYHPTGVRLHPVTGELYVLDGQAEGTRVLVFKPPFTTGMSADRQLAKQSGGQYSGLLWARGFCFDPGDTNIIWVADGGNSRLVKVDAHSGVLLDVIGQATVDGSGNSYYVRYDGTLNGIQQPDGDIGFDSDGNLYFTCVGGWTPVVRIPMPLQKSGAGYAVSDGEMMKEGMNQISGRTFNDFYGMSLWKNQLFLSDGPRLLVWTNFPSAPTFAEADFVIGQDNMSEKEAGGTFEGRNCNLQAVGSNYLFVSTSYKMFIFELPITGGGKNYPAFKTWDSGSGHVKWADNDQSEYFALSGGLAYDDVDNVLWVSDGNKNRVLRLRDPLSSTPKIEMVLGQTNKTAGAKNHGIGDWESFNYTVDAYGFAALWSLHLDNYRNLYVVDSGYEGRHDNSGNLRVVRFDYTNTVYTGEMFPFYPATAVFGKPDLTTTRLWNEAHRPRTPISLAFGPSNEMLMTCDSYGNPQGELVFYYEAPHVGVTPQPKNIVPTYFGNPAVPFYYGRNFIIQDHTWNRVNFHSPADTAPYINITNNNSTVIGKALASIAGTINAHVSGHITWNNDKGGAGEIPATPNWVITNIPIAVGGNLITVSGTNYLGNVASDTMTITRLPLPGEGLPVVTVISPDDTVDASVTHYTIKGVNNINVVGGMWWTTSKGGAGTFAAMPAWTIADIPLGMNATIITVNGTNVFGEVSSDYAAIMRELIVTSTDWQVLAVTNGTGYSGAGTGMKMNNIDGLVRNSDGDPYVYLQAHSPEGDAREQMIWRVPASIPDDNALSSWELVLAGVNVNGSGGEPGQVWAKISNVFYSAVWCDAAPGLSRDWGWHGFWTTDGNGSIVVGSGNIRTPNHIKSLEGWSACGQNIGGCISWTRPDKFSAVCTDRQAEGSGKDAQIRRMDTLTWLTTLADAECGDIDSDYSASAFDSGQNGRVFFFDCRASDGNNSIYCATNIFAGTENLSDIHPAFDIPESMSSDRPCDIVTLKHSRFGDNTVLAASAFTAAGRKIYLFNAGNPEYDPLDITPASGLDEWGNRLATYGPYLFMSYNAGNENPGLMRLSLFDYDLSDIGIPEPLGQTGLAGMIVLAHFIIKRRKH